MARSPLGNPMIEALVTALISIFRVVDFILDIAVVFSRTHRLACWATGSDKLIAVPADPKVLPPAAQRALAEAEARHRDGASFIDKYVSASCK